MLRLLLYFLIICIVGLGFSLLANYTGDLVLTFGSIRISTSLPIAAGSVIVALIAICVLWWLFKSIIFSPYIFRKHLRQQREENANKALILGLTAVLAGDRDSARQKLKKLKYLREDESRPLCQFLQAQSFLLNHDASAAIAVYETMRNDPASRLLGLHGLYREAIKSKAYEAAEQYAAEASALSPNLDWANKAMLNKLAADNQWVKAIELFDRNEKALPRAKRGTNTLKHLRAVLLTGQAIALFSLKPEEARKLALAALKYEADFIPAANAAASILFKLHEMRKATKLIEKLWLTKPHPDLALTYIQAHGNLTANARLKRAVTLAAIQPRAYESLVAVANAAYEAGEYSLARKKAESALKVDQRESGYLLLADIEQATTSDQGRIKEYLSLALRAPRDPAWMADSLILEEWAPVTPISGILDGVEWGTPMRQITRQHIQDSRFAMDATILPIASSALSDPKANNHQNRQKRTVATRKATSNSLTNPPIMDTVFDHKESDEPAISDRINVDDPGVNDKSQL